MIIVPIHQIDVPTNRIRKEFSEVGLWDLEASIKRLGLFHPPVVKEVNGRYRLVAGENRLRAVTNLAKIGAYYTHAGKQIEPGFIPVTLLAELTDIELREAELEENIRRSDLTWQERTAAEAELHELRRAQIPEHTMTDTAKEVFGVPGDKPVPRQHITTISESLLVASMLNDPDVRAAKTKTEALRIVQKKQELAARDALAARADVSSTRHTLFLGDSADLLPQFPDNTYDCIITDPPYGIEAGSFGAQAGIVAHNYVDSREWFLKVMPGICRDLFAVAAARAHLYIFFDMENYERLCMYLTDAGWTVWRHPIIWYKPNYGMLPRPEHAPRRCYEPILFASKGDKKVLRVAKDVIECPFDETKLHGAQKPVDLYCDLLSRSCNPMDKVLDPFMGSGTIFPAANRLKLVATGVELLESNFNIAKSRLKEE